VRLQRQNLLRLRFDQRKQLISVRLLSKFGLHAISSIAKLYLDPSESTTIAHFYLGSYKQRSAQPNKVSATELAQMGFCEKRMQLAHRYGEAASPAQRAAMNRGNIVHRQFYEQGIASQASDRRCFVSTCLFGEAAPQTQSLRTYRDVVLLTCPWGRCLVQIYYFSAPWLCRVLERWPSLQRPVRILLMRFANRCDQTVRRRRGK
jgi:hypothetical protein